MLLNYTFRKLNNFNYSISKLKRLYHNINDDVPMVNISLIKQTLKSKNLPFQEGHACIFSYSKICEDTKHKDCKIYINKVTGIS